MPRRRQERLIEGVLTSRIAEPEPAVLQIFNAAERSTSQTRFRKILRPLRRALQTFGCDSSIGCNQSEPGVHVIPIWSQVAPRRVSAGPEVRRALDGRRQDGGTVAFDR